MLFGIFQSAGKKNKGEIEKLHLQLEAAVYDNDEILVKTILSENFPGKNNPPYKINLNIKPTISDMDSLLHLAAAKNYSEIAKMLIEAGADININNAATRIFPLHTAAKYGSVGAAKILLDHGADINAPTNEGLTPLHRSVIHNQTTMAEFLIKQGARTDICNKGGKTAYDMAIDNKFYHFAELLGGTNPNACTAIKEWGKIDAQTISRTRTLNCEMILIEIFDFMARERITTAKFKETATAPERQEFDKIKDKVPIEEALKNLLEQGGTPDPKSITLSPRRMEKLPGGKHDL